MTSAPTIIAITGIQAAGKSTVARLLAQQFPRGAYIEGDTMQHMIVSGAEGAQAPLTLVVLAPRIEVVSQDRDLNRAKRPLGPEWARYLDDTLRATMTGVGEWFDTSDQTPAETVAAILARLAPTPGA